VYFAPNNGDQGFVDAIADAAALGITVCLAAGDNGSGDGATDGQAHVDFPASSPYALGCGGTKLVADVATGAVTSEVVWNETASGEGASGGGVSDKFALPSWQATAGVPARAAATGTGTVAGAASASGSAGGRGGPDVAGNADPTTGYQVYADGKAQVVGGTSAVAPLWAALISRLAEATGKRFGLIQTSLYADVTRGTDVDGFRDITSGNNGAYAAGTGWDACSGLGSPEGDAPLKRLLS